VPQFRGSRGRGARGLSFSLVIFDYDGVLADSLDQAILASGEFCRSVSHGRAPTKETIGALEIMTYPEIARSVGLPSEQVDRFSSYVFERFLEMSPSIPFFPGVEPLLRRISERELAIVSGNSGAVIRAKLASLGLARAADCVLGAFEPGDKAEKIRVACEHFGVDAGLACMIGDSASDVRHAKRAGAVSIAATWGWQSRRMLSKERPDYIVDSVRELADLIDSGGSR
jgi:phosphoglycolate phosphatase-like HAD superfamily hydrolase